MPYTLPLTVITQRNFVADFLQKKSPFIRETAIWLFWAPFQGQGSLDAAYHIHLRLIGKRAVTVITELFFARCYSCDTTSEYPLEIAVFRRWSQFDPKFQLEGDVHTNHSSCRKTGWIDLSLCGIRMSAELSFVLSQFTRVTDERTDRRATLR